MSSFNYSLKQNRTMVEKVNHIVELAVGILIGLIGGLITFYFKIKKDSLDSNLTIQNLETKKLNVAWETQEILIKYQNQLSLLQREQISLNEELKKIKNELVTANELIESLKYALNEARLEIERLKNNS